MTSPTDAPKVVSLKRPPRDLSARLRELADLADSGEVTEMVIAYVMNDRYEFTYGTSDANCLVMATLLQSNCIDNMRED